MFIEPTLLDIEKQWETNRDNFVKTEWKDTGLTPAEWAWLKHPSFWTSTRKLPERIDKMSWWDWSATHISGNNLKTNLTILKTINAPYDISSLTNILISASKVKLGLSQDDTTDIINHLSMHNSFIWKDDNNITVWHAAISTKDTNILKSLINSALTNNINLNDIKLDSNKNNLLHCAIQHDWENGVRILIEAGVSTEYKNNENLTPKEYSVEGEYKNAIKGFSLKKETVKKVEKPKVPKESTQMDLF